MGTVISLLASAASLAVKVWEYFTAKKHDELVQDAQRATDGEVNAAAGLNEVQIAKEARDNIASDIAADPISLRKSDGFSIGGSSPDKPADKT